MASNKLVTTSSDQYTWVSICRHGLSNATRPPHHWWGFGAVAGEWADVCGFSKRPNAHHYGKYVCMVHAQFLEKFWASVKETRAAIMKSGYIWTFLVTGTLTDHEGTTVIVYI